MTTKSKLPMRSKCENKAMHTCTSCILVWGEQNVSTDNNNNTINSILWGTYSFNWQPPTAHSKKCKIHFLALVSPSVCFLFRPFGFVVLKKSIRVTKNLPPTSSIYGKWMLGSIIKFHRERELGFNKVRKKAQHTNLTGGYFPIFSCFKI